MLLGESYYLALQQDHVELVTDPIERITETSVVTAGGRGRRRRCDSAGHRIRDQRYLSGIDVIGIGGAVCTSVGVRTRSAYLGVAVSGFPNFFMLYGPNTNQGGNSIIYILEAGARLVASAVSGWRDEVATSTSAPRPKSAFNDQLSADLERTIWTQCDSYFRSPTGPHRHPMAAFRTRLCEGDMATTAAGLAP